MPVCFSEEPQVHSIEKVDDESRTQIWLTPSDYLRFKVHIFKTVRVLQDDGATKQDDTEVYCSRGLENSTAQESRARYGRIKDAVRLVVEKQKTIEPEAIAEHYEQHTAQCRVRAQVLAMQDEEEVLFARFEEEVKERESEMEETERSMSDVLFPRRANKGERGGFKSLRISFRHLTRKATTNAAA